MWLPTLAPIHVGLLLVHEMPGLLSLLMVLQHSAFSQALQPPPLPASCFFHESSRIAWRLLLAHTTCRRTGCPCFTAATELLCLAAQDVCWSIGIDRMLASCHWTGLSALSIPYTVCKNFLPSCPGARLHDMLVTNFFNNLHIH